MSPSANRRWLWFRRVSQIAFLLTAIFATGLLVVNAVDYYRYWWAVNCAKILGPDGLRSLVDACVEVGRKGRKRLSGQDIPAVVRPFNPDWASVSEDGAQFGLYSHGDACVFLSLDIFEGNQTATVSDHIAGARAARPFWVKYPEKYQALHPANRLVTLGQGGMHEYIEWIVIPDRLLVVSRPGTGGAFLVGDIRLSESAQREIAGAIASIKPEVRGRSYTSGAFDGISLSIRTSSDGEPSDNDLGLANTWREEAGPLIDAIARLSPANYPLNAATYLRAGAHADLKYQTSLTWAEVARRDRPRLPWWCWWPRI